MGKGLVVLMCVISLIFFGILFLISKPHFSQEIPCLEEIAEDYCEEKGFYFTEVYWVFNWRFCCKENLKSIDPLIYMFSKEEIKECKGK